MKVETEEQQDPAKVVGEVIADVTVCARQAEALGQSSDLFVAAACRVLGALGGALRSAADRLGRQVLPALRAELLVKDGEEERASDGIAGVLPGDESGRAALVRSHANAFGVGGSRDGVTITALPDRPLTRAEVANLSAWLTLVGLLSDADILPALRANGYLAPSSAGESTAPGPDATDG